MQNKPFRMSNNNKSAAISLRDDREENIQVVINVQQTIRKWILLIVLVILPVIIGILLFILIKQPHNQTSSGSFLKI